MARLNLILCDWCKESSTNDAICKIAIGEPDDHLLFEVCIKCQEEIILRCEEKPDFKPKKKITRSAEKSDEVKKNTCKHEKEEFLEPNNLRCEDCGNIRSA